MNFGPIIERSLKLVRSHTVLWKLGLLALFTEGITSGVVSGPPFPMPPSANEDKTIEHFGQRASDWASANPALFGILIALVVIIVLLVWYLSLRAKAGLILTVTDLEAGKSAPRFLEAYRRGGSVVWRLIGMYVLFGLIVSVVLAVPFAIVGSLARQVNETALFGFFLLALPLIVVIAAYVSFITKMAERAVILSGQRIWAALGTAHRILFGHFGQSLLAMLIDFGLQVVFIMLVMAIVIIIVGLAAVIALLLAAILPKAILAAVAGAAAILLLAGFVLLGGWFAAFTISYWTLVYRAFDYLKIKKGDQ